MAIPPRTRKRVRAIPRAADGSAFQKCDMCGISVAIALADMHECQSSQEVKKFKGIRASKNEFTEERFLNQPRSAFCFFKEEFKATCESDDPIEIDRKGFETWKNMSKEEREPYIRKAALVNFHYDKALREEEEKEDRLSKPGEGKATVDWKSDWNRAFCEHFGDSDSSGWLLYEESDE